MLITNAIAMKFKNDNSRIYLLKQTPKNLLDFPLHRHGSEKADGGCGSGTLEGK